MYPVSSHCLKLFSILLHPVPDSSSLPILSVHSPAANVLFQRIVLIRFIQCFSVIFLLPFAALSSNRFSVLFTKASCCLPIASNFSRCISLPVSRFFMQSILHIADRIVQGLIQFITQFADISSQLVPVFFHFFA